MSNPFKVIEESTWPRAMHCQIFRNCVEPSFCITFEVDITEFKRFVKDHHLSFTLSMVHTLSTIGNKIEAFRYRFQDGKVVLFEKIDTAFTYLNGETNLFKVVNVPFQESLAEYVALAKKIADEQSVYFTGPLKNDVFQCSPIPWITYTHVSHTNSGKRDNATPLFDWGKFYEKDGRIILPVSVQAHHSFVDGIHIGEFVNKLQSYLDSFKDFNKSSRIKDI